MKRFNILLAGSLFLLLGPCFVSYAQDTPDNKDQARPPQSHPQANPPEANPGNMPDAAQENKQAQEDQTKQGEEKKEEKQSKEETKEQKKQQKDETKRAHREQGNDQKDQTRAAAGSEHGTQKKDQRMPDEKLRSSFGHQHHFKVSQPVIVENRPRIQVSGFWFEFVDPWPVDWAYSDDCYIDFIDGEYFLFDLMHPGVRIAVVVVS